MLKIFIFTLLFVAGHARFNVTVNGTVCVLLNIDGVLNLEAHENNALKANRSLSFEAAEVLSTSTCTEIRLKLDDAQVWFQFNENKSQWLVTPIVAFDAKTLGLNESESVNGTAPSLTLFNKNESFSCQSIINHEFTLSATKAYNYTAVAITSNFKVQASEIVNDTFTPGAECDQDRTTAAPTSTSTPTPTSTPPPEPVYSCSDNGTLRFKLQANISLAIQYEKSDNSYATAFVEVPRGAQFESRCNETNEESLTISFFDGWTLEYVFQRTSNNSKDYYVSNITLLYNTAHFGNGSKPENLTVSYYDANKGYLKASTDGYYVCNSNSSVKITPNVTLYTAELKYKAFNDKTGKDDWSGTVSECSADEETSSVVPIAVGAALAGLVVIVLIAYLIGRRRSRKSGYESV